MTDGTFTSILKPSRRSFMKGVGGAMTAALAMPYIARAQAAPLYINTWGGPWEDAARANLFDPFTKETGIEIRTLSPVSFAKLAQQVNTGTYEFDITTLGGGELVRANQAGIIETLEEPYPGGLFENGIASHAFATVMAWRSDKFEKGPQSWAEFWDVERFPGARSMQRYAARVLPIALLADGVAVKDLYPLDIDRAFASLDRIKDHIRVWWTAGAQSTQILRDGEVDLIGIWHGRFYEAQKAGAPVAMSWNQARSTAPIGWWPRERQMPRPPKPSSSSPPAASRSPASPRRPTMARSIRPLSNSCRRKTPGACRPHRKTIPRPSNRT
ncbi:ABC transporter substrate-binding protein [Pseudaminobacter salicylatoxidans]|uniref:ABC transporter substrate-binding protein n=1 Tax=Pseudaminobacter salicylatoxidans TaxID=93369 RepID=UPI00030DE6EC|nr:ABC transporter substrate-binding protein [Pseudaminobacter salicylatoxidans]